MDEPWYIGAFDSATVKCRKCGGPATFERIFERLRGEAARHAKRDPAAIGTEFGRGFIRNRFPYLNDGQRSPGRYGFGLYNGAQGAVTCPRCVSRYLHTLHWPEDAYYSVEDRGGVLWAWNRRYLIGLRDYIAAPRRDAPGWAYFSRKIPKEFLDAKRREPLVRKLDGLLRAA